MVHGLNQNSHTLAKQSLIVAAILLISGASGYAVYQQNFNNYLDMIGAEAESIFAISNSYVSLYSRLRDKAKLKNLPVPFTYRAMVTDMFNAKNNSPEDIAALMVGMPDRYISTPPVDDQMRQTLEALKLAPDSHFSGLIKLRGRTTLRIVYPAIADEQSCVECHNLQETAGNPFQIGDMLGGYVIDREVQNAKSRYLNYGLFSAVLAFIALTSGYLVWLQNRALRVQALQLTYLAERDSLTGCLNHRGLHQREAKLLEQKLNNTAILAIDLDHFERINESCGHETGDKVLETFAHIVRGGLRENDVFSRIGGAEFLVYLTEIDEELAKVIANSICRTVVDMRVSPHAADFELSVSIGAIHVSQTLSGSFRSFKKIAYASLYKAKRQGRNQVVWFDDSMNNDSKPVDNLEFS